MTKHGPPDIPELGSVAQEKTESPVERSHIKNQANMDIGWLFIVLRPAQEFFTYMETSPLRVKGYLCSALRAFVQGKIFVPHLLLLNKAYARLSVSGPLLLAERGLYWAARAMAQGLGFSCLIRKNAPFSRLLRHT